VRRKIKSLEEMRERGGRVVKGGCEEKRKRRTESFEV
jgi:hypothetical protein